LQVVCDTELRFLDFCWICWICWVSGRSTCLSKSI